MIDWNIQSRSHVCSACQKPFEDKEGYHTLLFDDRQAYLRMDVCEACWNTQHGQGTTDKKGFISHWQGVYLVPPAAPPDAIQKDTAESLLRKLVERKDPKHAAAAYILAVMLERKRILKVKAQVTEEGRRMFIYEYGKTGDIFAIADPDLKFDQLDEVQRDLDQLLAHGLDGPQPAAAVSPAEPAEGTESAPAEDAPVPA